MCIYWEEYDSLKMDNFSLNTMFITTSPVKGAQSYNHIKDFNKSAKEPSQPDMVVMNRRLKTNGCELLKYHNEAASVKCKLEN